MPTIIRGNVTVRSDNQQLRAVVAGTTAHPLAGTTTIGTGDYLDSIIVMTQVFGTIGSCAVYLSDGVTGTVLVHGTLLSGSVSNPAGDQGTKQIYLGVTSRFGPWRVTTQAGVAVTAIGRFSG